VSSVLYVTINRPVSGPGPAAFAGGGGDFPVTRSRVKGDVGFGRSNTSRDLDPIARPPPLVLTTRSSLVGGPASSSSLKRPRTATGASLTMSSRRTSPFMWGVGRTQYVGGHE
jgi:hypothetical protein